MSQHFLQSTLRAGAVSLTAGLGLLASSAHADPVPQYVAPIFNQTNVRAAFPDEIFDAPSATIKLPIGHRIDVPDDFNLLITPHIIQRLTDRSYWVTVGGFQSLVYVGNSGVLLIDCAGHVPGDGQRLLDAIATITPLPVTQIVYSHTHTDHIGQCVYVQQQHPSVEIVASKWAAEEIARNGYPLAAPTKTVNERYGNFKFEGNRFRIITPVPVAHTTADSYIVTPDRVLHASDFVHPLRLPFVNNMVNQNMDGYLVFLRHLAGEREHYDFASWGHLNVGYARDVDMTLTYFETMYEAWWETLQQNAFPNFMDPTNDNAAVWFRNFWDKMAEELFKSVIPDFGDTPMIELARDHAERVHEFMFVYRFNPATGEPIPPDFSPIYAPR